MNSLTKRILIVKSISIVLLGIIFNTIFLAGYDNYFLKTKRFLVLEKNKE